MHGVFPVPPAVMLPTEMTGTPAWIARAMSFVRLARTPRPYTFASAESPP